MSHVSLINLVQSHTNNKTPLKDDFPVPSTSASSPKLESSSTATKGRIHAHPHPISISTLSTSRPTLLKGFDQFSGRGQDDNGRSHKPKKFKEQGKKKENEIVSAKQTIFESGNVGVDLRARATVMTTREVYMKPAGVDEPGNNVSAPFKKDTKSEDDFAEGPRQKMKKNKRERDGDEDDGRKKSKRKRKTPESANE